MLNKKFTALAAILLYAIMIIVNTLANALPLNGKNTGQVSAQYETLFAPAGYTFSIWGIIYLLLAIFCIQLLIQAFSKNNSKTPSTTVQFLFLLTCILNSVWIFAWHFEHIAISLIIMVLLLLTIIVLYLQLEKHTAQYPKAKYFYLLPISIYFGWISVATIANAATFGISIFPDLLMNIQVQLTIIMMSIGALAGILMILKKKDLFFAAVIIWAYGGIIVKRTSVSTIHFEIITAAYVLASVIGLTMIYSALKHSGIVRLDRK
jgi:hypothetical protein